MVRKSAIKQMLMGTHGHIESVVCSNEHYKAVHNFTEKYKLFKEKYADNSEMLKLFDEVCDAHDADQATAEVDFYKSGFSFGVLMGIDIMRENLKTD